MNFHSSAFACFVQFVHVKLPTHAETLRARPPCPPGPQIAPAVRTILGLPERRVKRYSSARSREAADPAPPARWRPSDECGEPCRESIRAWPLVSAAAWAGGYWTACALSSEESKEETECAAWRVCTVGGCENEDGSAGVPAASLPPLPLGPEAVMGDIPRIDPIVSARPRLYVVDASLVCRECPLRRPGGGFEIVEAAPCCEYGGDRKRCCVFGGGAACWGPAAFLFRGDSPTAWRHPR